MKIQHKIGYQEICRHSLLHHHAATRATATDFALARTGNTFFTILVHTYSATSSVAVDVVRFAALFVRLLAVLIIVVRIVVVLIIVVRIVVVRIVIVLLVVVLVVVVLIVVVPVVVVPIVIVIVSRVIIVVVAVLPLIIILRK